MSVKIVHVSVSHTDIVSQVSIDEACRLCQIDLRFFNALVDEGIFEPPDPSDEWLLREAEFARLKKAARLYLDLGVNPPGIALALELLAQLQRPG